MNNRFVSPLIALRISSVGGGVADLSIISNQKYNQYLKVFKNKIIQGNYNPTNMQYLLDGIEKCNFTDEQFEWIEQTLIFADQGAYYAYMKEFAPKKFEKEVKEEVKGWGNFKGLKS